MHIKICPANDEVKAMYEQHRSGLPGDAGFDLFCPETLTIQPGETAKVDLQIGCSAHSSQSDASVAYFVMPRSSISKTPLRLANSVSAVGLIDAGYRGNLIAMLDNIKTEPYTITRGDRLLQIVSFDGTEITHELVDELDKTLRGSGGFGSTGAGF